MKTFLLAIFVLISTTCFAGHIDTGCGIVYWEKQEAYDHLNPLLQRKAENKTTAALLCREIHAVARYLHKQPVKINFRIYANQSSLQEIYGDKQALPKHSVRAFYGGGTVHINPYSLNRCVLDHEITHALIDIHGDKIPVLYHELIAERVQQACTDGIL